MIVDLQKTSVAAVSKKLLELREDVGSLALGRVLTLIVLVDAKRAEAALETAMEATRQHPSRIVCVVEGDREGDPSLEAQIRVGGDAGASEMVVLRLRGELADHAVSVVLPLLLADCPIVAWWPYDAPDDVASHPIGRLAQRRITDAEHSSAPAETLAAKIAHYADGDTDLVWTRTTKWRGLLAAALDQPPFESVSTVTVTGGLDSASTDLLAAWLGEYLDADVVRARTPAGTGLVGVRLHRRSGPIDLVRPDGLVAVLEQPGRPVRRVALSRRGDAECLADELARLDADEVYERALRRGLPRVRDGRHLAASEAAAEGLGVSADEARSTVRQIAEELSDTDAATMVDRTPPPDDASEEQVRRTTRERLAEVEEERADEQK